MLPPEIEKDSGLRLFYNRLWKIVSDIFVKFSGENTAICTVCSTAFVQIQKKSNLINTYWHNLDLMLAFSSFEC